MDLATVFARCQQENRAALIGYLTAGYPDSARGVQAIETLVSSGADIVEVGIPYTDPGMDGPVIQLTSQLSLKSGFRVKDVFTTVCAGVKAGAAVVVMSYYNPILQYGLENFARDLKEAGGCGVIIPDLPPEEASEWEKAANSCGISTIFIAAQTSTPKRLQLISQSSTGFVYAASRMGVTGLQNSLDANACRLVANVRDSGAKWVCVGIGVSNAEQASVVAGWADGVIVGTALIKTILPLQTSNSSLTATLIAEDAQENLLISVKENWAQHLASLENLTKELKTGVYR